MILWNGRARWVTGRRHRATGWREESGTGFPLRWYRDGEPTGHVAVVHWDDRSTGTGGVVLENTDVRLLWQGRRITVSERTRDRTAGRLVLPLAWCSDAEVVSGPGGPPDPVTVRLTFRARFTGLGDHDGFRISLVFPAAARADVDRVAEAIGRSGRRLGADDRARDVPPRSERSRPVPPGPDRVLRRLAVVRVPEDDDWVVFRGLPSSAAVLGDKTAPDAGVGDV